LDTRGIDGDVAAVAVSDDEMLRFATLREAFGK
jgi:hypothetical protein